MGQHGLDWRITKLSSVRLPLWALFGIALFRFVTSAQALPPCVGSCPSGQACLLTYGAAGVVRDRVTGLPIGGATVTVLDASSETVADGTYEVSGTRPETCNVDYLLTVAATAPGYAAYSLSWYASDVSPRGLLIELDPVATRTPTEVRTPTPTPPGCPVPTAPQCPTGQEPDCISNECIVGCGCKACPPCPHGQVFSGAINRCDCVPAGSISPTPTPRVCPQLTPCPLGEQPRACTPDQCGLGCGCEACPSCPAGEIPAPAYNVCQCIPDERATPPTRTPTATVCPAASPCPPGQRRRVCTPDRCDLGCGCEPCAACPDGQVFIHANSCACVADGRTVSATPTATPTPPLQCTPPTLPLCAAGQETICTEEDCRFTCECRPCSACPLGRERVGPGCLCVFIENPPDSRDASSGGCAIDRTPAAVPWPVLLLVPLLALARRWKRSRVRFRN